MHDYSLGSLLEILGLDRHLQQHLISTSFDMLLISSMSCYKSSETTTNHQKRPPHILGVGQSVGWATRKA